MSNTIQLRPVRSTRPPVCLSGVSGRLSRSSRKSVRSASTGASVSAAKKRESAEREGSRSRRNLRHEGNGERLEALVKRFQGAFAADGIAEKNRKKVDHLVVSEAPSHKTHPLLELAEDALLAKMGCH